MSLSETLDLVFNKPALYIGVKSVTRLRAFMDGYRLATETSEPTNDHELYRGFHQWVAKRFRITTSHGWDSIILFMSSDERDAFDLAKELWYEYKEQSMSTS
jgi:hypothetical protein